MEYSRSFMIALLLIGLISTAYPKPSDSVDQKNDEYDDDFQGDDNYDYEDEDKSNPDDDQNALDNNEASFSSAPSPTAFFDIPYIEQEARAGDDVILFCEVKNFGLSNIVMWYNGSNVMTNSKYVIGNPRVTTLENNAIKVSHAQSYDSGDYYCEVLPERIRLHVKLRVIGARLAVYSHDRDVTNRSMTFRQGERVEFECRAFELPSEATIKWSLHGKRLTTPRVTSIHNGRVVIEDIDSHHAGTYQCLGDDNSARPFHAAVTINVQYTPKVSTHRHHVNVDEQDTAELYCNYKADPIAFAQWKKNDEYLPIVAMDKYKFDNVVLEGRNRTILHVKNVEKNDLGEYECEVKNSLGVASARVFLQYEPETPQFETLDISDNKVTLHWLVRSKQPLVEAILSYKINGTIQWSTESQIKTEKHREHTGIWKLRHEMELSPGLWHAQVKARNTVGFSKFSQQHDFIVEPVINDNSIPQDIIYAADISGVPQTKATGNSASYCTMVPFVFLMCLFSSLKLVPSREI